MPIYSNTELFILGASFVELNKNLEHTMYIFSIYYICIFIYITCTTMTYIVEVFYIYSHRHTENLM